ncbi:efflux RND transporter periplasmic adaptor subunit [Reichenbachiella sp. MALMAid0571]|uniref:efflux RND transporter periplasmic adaptor subunit n=1 Tax=Reichenbachiella sp. MALMAid0571 TaxID=3143939 RepID=UPI0032E0100F
MKKIIPFIIAITLATTSCNNNEAATKAGVASALQVEAYRVIAQPFSNELLTTAQLMAEEQVELMAPMAGQVLTIYFKEGEKVAKGQKLIRLDDRSWKAQLVGVNAELDAAQKDYDRKKELLSVEGSSQEEVDNALSQIEILKSQLQQLQINISLANVSAPFSGQLGMRDFSEGAFLKQGDLITTLSANKQLKVDFNLAQTHSKSIEIGKTVLVLVGQDTLEAKIYAVNPVVDVQTRTINVRALLERKENNSIMPGAFAEVLITTNLIDDALLIPTQAVVPSIAEQTVYVYKNGKAVRKVVVIGDRTADKVHIVSGIFDGDTVLTTGLLAVKDGMDLEIQSIK